MNPREEQQLRAMMRELNDRAKVLDPDVTALQVMQIDDRLLLKMCGDRKIVFATMSAVIKTILRDCDPVQATEFKQLLLEVFK